MADTSTSTQSPKAEGPNAWLVDEMYEKFLDDPSSVSESWQDFFADYQGGGNANTRGSVTTRKPARPAPAETPDTPADSDGKQADTSSADTTTDTEPTGPQPERIKGVGARIVENMEASLGVPTATSYREIPAKLLEVNRGVINGYLARTYGGKVSFTHLIGWAVVRAIADHLPVMNNGYATDDDGNPTLVRRERVGLGIAVDVEKKDGSRSLLVPVIKDADQLDFRGFWNTYEELIRKVRTNKLSPADFDGISITLTNPGTIGTRQSVPRLMPGQGVIIGAGSIDYPPEFAAADRHALADLGVGKVVTLSSTYDHRIIQGAESGLFLKKVNELLLGEEGFYDEIFAALGVPYEPVRWRVDVNPVNREETLLEKQTQVDKLINMYRVRGHLIADLDPLRWKEPTMHSELDPATYGLTIWDLDREFLCGGLGGRFRMELSEILRVLRDAYCRTIGVEYMHIQEPEEKAWVQSMVEGVSRDVVDEDQRHILDRLNAAEALEQFLSKKYVGQKRFGLDGAESTIPLIDAVIEAAADEGLDEVVMGMAHRGRLNVLVNIVGKEYRKLFGEFEGYVDPDQIEGSGDVKYHLGQRGKYQSRAGNQIDLELAPNPSHLEAVDPVVVGMARAKQDLIDQPESYSVLPLLLHGDAAFAGQGVVAEMLNCSDIAGYRVGGTVHLVINNQLGFTTTPDAARSSTYATDVAKMVQAPILHVNGDDPEACFRVAKLAFTYRQRFHKDVVIDMWCYRRHGHNEGDDPSYTQPLMYRRIDEMRTVRKLYVESLVKRGDISIEDAEAAMDDFQSMLQSALEETRESAPPDIDEPPERQFAGVLPRVDTGIASDTVDRIWTALNTVPEDFTVHPKLAKQFETRRKMYEAGEIDWALGEAMAFGSLLVEGIPVRLSGQDSRRGTFSHRHSFLVDYEDATEYAPLAHITEGQAKLWIYNSLLSEYAALGFEYGYSLTAKDALVCWEAQFGDFANGGQIIIDQFLVAAEEKWAQRSGLVLLLPHGYEGQGPEHSSARIERFLILCAGDNIQVANATTSAQFFHLLRRQMHREVRKPLVVFTPKSLLRAKVSRSSVDELTSGSFLEVIDDPAYTSGDRDRAGVRRVVLASGKVAPETMAQRDERDADVAVIRVEQLYPWPFDLVAETVTAYPNVSQVAWLQEEPENMGPWNFVKGRLYDGLGKDYDLEISRISRPESASPATGSHQIHLAEAKALQNRVFADLP